MDMPFSRERAIEMSSHAHLTYVAYEHGTEFVHNILKSGHPPFVQSYQTIDFLNTPRKIVDEGELVCCGYVASTINQIVIAVRGTENIDDYFVDLLLLPNSNHIHSGFYAYIESFWEQIQMILQRENNSKKHIVTTGHSLGGAAAMLIANRLNQLDQKPFASLETYTFGAPPVSTTQLPTDTPVYRFRNAGDNIPHLHNILALIFQHIPFLKRVISKWKPELPQILSQYSHVGTEYLLNRRFQLHPLDKPEIKPAWQWSLFLAKWLSSLSDAEGELKQESKKGRKIARILASLIKYIIQDSLQEHRAIRYVELLNYGKLPPWQSLNAKIQVSEVDSSEEKSSVLCVSCQNGRTDYMTACCHKPICHSCFSQCQKHKASAYLGLGRTSDWGEDIFVCPYCDRKTTKNIYDPDSMAAIMSAANHPETALVVRIDNPNKSGDWD